MRVVVAIESDRFLDGHGVRLVLREVKAEAKRLNAIVRLAGGAGQRVVVFEAHIEVPRMRFAKGRTALAPNTIGHARECREVALVSAVDEGRSPKLGLRARLAQILRRDADQLHRGSEILRCDSVDALAGSRDLFHAIAAHDTR